MDHNKKNTLSKSISIFNEILIDEIIKKLKNIEFKLNIINRDIQKINKSIDKINNEKNRW